MSRSVTPARTGGSGFRSPGGTRDAAVGAGLTHAVVLRVDGAGVRVVEAWPTPAGAAPGNGVARICRGVVASGRAEIWRRPSVLAGLGPLVPGTAAAAPVALVTVPLDDGEVLVGVAPEGVAVDVLEAELGASRRGVARPPDDPPAVWTTPARDRFLDRLLADLVLSARRILRARRAVLTVLAEGGRTVERLIVSDEGVDGYVTPEVPPGRGVLSVLGDDPRPLRLARVGDDLRVRSFPPDCARDQSFLGIALTDGALRGALYVVDAAAGAFSASDEDLITLLGTQAENAVESVDALRREHARLLELEALRAAVADMQDLLTGALANASAADVDVLTRRVLDLAGARSACVAILRDGCLEVRSAVGERADELRGLRSRPGVEQIATRVRRVLGDAVTALPLRVGDGLVGVLLASGEVATDVRGRELLDVMRGQVAMLVAHEVIRSAEVDRQRATLDVEVAQARERALAEGYRRALAAQEVERGRIARELHDEAGQVLAAVALHLRGIESREPDPGYRERLAALREVVNEAATNLHDLITHLRPPSLRRYGLPAAVQQLVDTLTGLGDMRVGVDLEALPEVLPEEDEVAVFRVVQEGLSNVARHSGAANASVTAARVGDRLRILVEDDGRGFDADRVDGRERYGLLGLRERLELLGGRLTIESAPGSGTTLIAELALKPAA